MIPSRPEQPGAQFLIVFATSRRSCASPIFPVRRPRACGAGPTAIDSFRLTAESDKPSFLFWNRNEQYFPHGTRTAAAGWRFVAGVVRRECNVQNRFGHV